jgi:hypothetical protein
MLSRKTLASGTAKVSPDVPAAPDPKSFFQRSKSDSHLKTGAKPSTSSLGAPGGGAVSSVSKRGSDAGGLPLRSLSSKRVASLVDLHAATGFADSSVEYGPGTRDPTASNRSIPTSVTAALLGRATPPLPSPALLSVPGTGTPRSQSRTTTQATAGMPDLDPPASSGGPLPRWTSRPASRGAITPVLGAGGEEGEGREGGRGSGAATPVSNGSSTPISPSALSIQARSRRSISAPNSAAGASSSSSSSSSGAATPTSPSGRRKGKDSGAHGHARHLWKEGIITVMAANRFIHAAETRRERMAHDAESKEAARRQTILRQRSAARKQLKKRVGTQMLQAVDVVLHGWPSPSQINDYIWLGSQEDAQDLEKLSALGVTHVLNVARQCPPVHEMDFLYLRIDLLDHPGEDLTSAFAAAFDHIRDARACGGQVLVHCVAGMSRSVAIVAAWLVQGEGMSLKQAMDLVSQLAGGKEMGSIGAQRAECAPFSSLRPHLTFALLFSSSTFFSFLRRSVLAGPLRFPTSGSASHWRAMRWPWPGAHRSRNSATTRCGTSRIGAARRTSTLNGPLPWQEPPGEREPAPAPGALVPRPRAAPSCDRRLFTLPGLALVQRTVWRRPFPLRFPAHFSFPRSLAELFLGALCAPLSLIFPRTVPRPRPSRRVGNPCSAAVLWSPRF